ncbi:MAG: spore germination protein [Oscillospiraceae bacterium]|jgi:stage V sporulation protein AF|nr:spore germination protein [Oscillospiraceae bacterium]
MFTGDYNQNHRTLDQLLRTERNFDLCTRVLAMNGKQGQLYFVDGMIRAETLNKIMDELQKLTPAALKELGSAREFCDRAVPYGETDVVNDEHDFVTFVLSGCVGLLLEGYPEALLIDVRDYPARPVMEPENDRVLRGPREGFVETLISNTAMVRRRLRDPRLTMELIQVGERSKSDVVLCYLEDKADPKLLERLRGNLKSIRINTLTMGLESLTECMKRRQWWNPFPRARLTERPDCAAACVAEGQVVLLMDNTPAGMILPTGIFDFLQDTNDYCFLPVTGTYLRWLRLLVSLLTTFLTPAFYLITRYPQLIPEPLRFLKIHEPIAIPLLLQFLLIELVIGGLKLASLNTPSALSGSFAVIGALVLGDLAVKSELMVPEAVLLMAFVALANFAQPSYELGYALGFTRVFLLILSAAFGIWGALAGLVATLITISTTKTLAGNCYWYPLIPFRPRALARLFLRWPISNENS